MSPLSTYLSRYVAQTREKMASITDSRVKLVHEILKGIKVVKFYAYENDFIHRVDELRQEELKFVRRLGMYKEVNGSLATATPVLMAVATFVLYSLFEELTAAIAFTVLALYASLRMAIKVLPQVINTVSEVRN